jgi:LysR family transcriptional regulator, benzoate and cis,cis-muconate-responsive activator of ben and cat genes
MPREYQYPFELRHLVYFREVARTLHFRRAAEALAVAQPALSRQIAQLEGALGLALFRRHQRRVELTAAGRALLEQVEPLLERLKRLPQEVQAAAAGQTGTLRVGFTGLAMATVLPSLLREFQRSHPGIRVELTESPTVAQVRALGAGEIDAGFLHPDALPAGFWVHEMLREKNGLLLPTDHPRAGRRRLSLVEVATEPFVLFPRVHNPGFYDRVLAAFAAAGVVPHIADEVWPRANAIGLVRAGLGLTFMCPSEARHLPADVVFRPLQGPAPESRLALAWREASDHAPALPAFVAAVRRRARPRGADQPGD